MLCCGTCFAVGFDNVNESMIKCCEMGSAERRRLSLLRKSLDWNSAFCTSQGDSYIYMFVNVAS